jgi:hypothetical protein
MPGGAGRWGQGGPYTDTEGIFLGEEKPSCPIYSALLPSIGHKRRKKIRIVLILLLNHPIVEIYHIKWNIL